MEDGFGDRWVKGRVCAVQPIIDVYFRLDVDIDPL